MCDVPGGQTAVICRGSCKDVLSMSWYGFNENIPAASFAGLGMKSKISYLQNVNAAQIVGRYAGYPGKDALFPKQEANNGA